MTLYTYSGTASDLERHLESPLVRFADKLGRQARDLGNLIGYDAWSDLTVTTSDNDDQVEAVKQEQPYRHDR